MIKIICVGKLKEQHFKNATLEYLKRLSKYSKIEVIECQDFGDMDEVIILDKERVQIEKNIDNRDFVITLEIDGKELSSTELSKLLETTLISNSNITFIIGGSHGIHPKIKERSNCALSFSKLTFPHQLFRVMLLEQIYRAFKIQNNETYHK